MPENTLKAFADHGAVGALVPTDGVRADEMLAEFEAGGIGVDALAARLQEEGKQSFVKSWTDLLQTIESQLS
jgi:transaldolase